MTDNLTGIGHLMITARTAGGALPVSGVLITVSSVGENREVLGVLTTSESGNTRVLEIATPPKSASLSPGYAGDPYTTVLIEADKDGFYSGQYLSAPIFPDVLTVQPVNLLPLPDFFDGTPSEGTQFFDESEGFDL